MSFTIHLPGKHNFKPVIIQCLTRFTTLLLLLFITSCSDNSGSRFSSSPTCTTSAADNTTSGGILLRANLDPFDGTAQYSDVWAENNIAFVGSYYAGEGVGIYDIANPDAPELITRYTPGGGHHFNDVKVHNGIGYFGSQSGAGVHIVDVSDPASPLRLAVINSSNGGVDGVHNVFWRNNFLYVVEENADDHTLSSLIRVFDVTIPGNPFPVQQVIASSGESVHDITIVNNTLIVSSLEGATDIFDVSSISATQAPTRIVSIDTGPYTHSNWLSSDGNILASARETENGDVRLYDISNPANPRLLSTIGETEIGVADTSPHNPVIVGDFLYVSWYRAGLQVFDISDPANPQKLGAYDSFIDDTGSHCVFGGNWGVYPFLGPDRVLLSDMNSGLFIVDVSPALP